MNINGISPSNTLTQIGTGGKSGIDGANNTGDGFGSFVKDALESLEKSQKGAEMEIGKAIKGESTDLHKTIIELQSADLKFQLGLQIRNKFIGAYEEIMRMQV